VSTFGQAPGDCQRHARAMRPDFRVRARADVRVQCAVTPEPELVLYFENLRQMFVPDPKLAEGPPTVGALLWLNQGRDDPDAGFRAGAQAAICAQLFERTRGKRYAHQEQLFQVFRGVPVR